MTVITLTYGDDSPSVRDDIGLALRELLTHYGATLYVDRFKGTGQWGDTLEHSGVIVAEVPLTDGSDGLFAEVAVQTLRSRVQEIATNYRQEAIGCIFAHPTRPTLVTPEEVI